ncbi:MAG: hypothetical protein HN736_04915 [Anaerolineae bacterium]|nr:hypothetical protein [Anaerolineae bacterium]MBT4841112.1 hypothetical protein [Anaerolineae bacterium]MBT6062303.1 hypothetical protein [Anaerolineae bacterium]MBT7017459.1 hypothetical protein [Anaerolineae bacterium]MBT7601071.1 hypothetical protein [Anaerolineae bacterium]
MFTKIKIILPISIILAALFAFFESGNYFASWLSAALIFFLGLSALFALWRWAGKSQKLLWVITLALLLRLTSAVALQVFLPINGYQDSEQQQAGYVFYDAFRRDTAAYDLAQSDAPLLSAFSQKDHTDQYGGLLAFSAGVYRYLSPDAHCPLIIALFSALVAALGIPFFWMAAKELGSEKLALPAVWIFALYPESILMGSSQMREPFLITLVAITLWAFLAWQRDKKYHPAQWGLGLGFLAMLLISPAIAIFQLIFLSVYALINNELSRISTKQIIIVITLILLSLFLLSSALSTTKLDSASPLGAIVEWTQRAILWDMYQLERGSGWVQKLFEEMPASIHIPFVTAYGLTQPVLPAAIIEPTTYIWKFLGIMRALGWYLLAPILLYGFIAIPKLDSPQARRIWTWFGLACLTWIILASLRAGGDQWDNPRYRVIFLALQALFTARAWVTFRERRDAWLPRLLTVEAIFLAFFTQWYASRYYVRFGTLSFGAMVAWILSLSVIIVMIGIIQDRKKAL